MNKSLQVKTFVIKKILKVKRQSLANRKLDTQSLRLYPFRFRENLICQQCPVFMPNIETNQDFLIQLQVIETSLNLKKTVELPIFG